MLTNHQWGPVKNAWAKFHKRYHNHQLPKLAWESYNQIFIKSPSGHWINQIFSPIWVASWFHKTVATPQKRYRNTNNQQRVRQQCSIYSLVSRHLIAIDQLSTWVIYLLSTRFSPYDLFFRHSIAIGPEWYTYWVPDHPLSWHVTFNTDNKGHVDRPAAFSAEKVDV